MASDLYEKFAGELTCKICLDRFKDPRELPCQHSFCMRCLKNVKLVYMPLSGHVISCPLCRGVHPLPAVGVEGYPKDFKLGGFLEVLKQHEEQGSGGEGEGAAPSTGSSGGTAAESSHRLPVSSGIPDTNELADGIERIALTDPSLSNASETQTDTCTSTDPPDPPAAPQPNHHWYQHHPPPHPHHPHPPHPPYPPPHPHHPPPHHHHPPPHHHHPPPHHHHPPPHPPYPHHPPPHHHHPPPHPHHPHHPPPPHHHPRHFFGPHFRHFRPRPPHRRGSHHHP